MKYNSIRGPICKNIFIFLEGPIYLIGKQMNHPTFGWTLFSCEPSSDLIRFGPLKGLIS